MPEYAFSPTSDQFWRMNNFPLIYKLYFFLIFHPAIYAMSSLSQVLRTSIYRTIYYLLCKKAFSNDSHKVNRFSFISPCSLVIPSKRERPFSKPLPAFVLFRPPANCFPFTCRMILSCQTITSAERDCATSAFCCSALMYAVAISWRSVLCSWIMRNILSISSCRPWNLPI